MNLNIEFWLTLKRHLNNTNTLTLSKQTYIIPLRLTPTPPPPTSPIVSLLKAKSKTVVNNLPSQNLKPTNIHTAIA